MESYHSVGLETRTWSCAQLIPQYGKNCSPPTHPLSQQNKRISQLSDNMHILADLNIPNILFIYLIYSGTETWLCLQIKPSIYPTIILNRYFSPISYPLIYNLYNNPILETCSILFRSWADWSVSSMFFAILSNCPNIIGLSFCDLFEMSIWHFPSRYPLFLLHLLIFLKVIF